MPKNRPGKAVQKRPAASAAIAARFQEAVGHHQRGELAQAESLYRALIAQVPGHFDALHLLGLVQCQKRDFGAAVELIRRAVDVDPRNPNKAAALSNLGIALHELGRSAEALAAFDRSLALKPENAETLYNRANVLLAMQRVDEALASYDRALTLRPDNVAAYNNRGNALLALQRPVDALASFDRAVAIRADFAEAHNNRATALMALQRYEEALAACDRALAQKSDFAEALNNRGNALRALHRYDEAAKSFARLIDTASGFDHALGDLVDCELRGCDWANVRENSARIVRALAEGRRAALPWVFLGASGSAAAQLACARAFIADKHPASATPLWRGERYRHDRIRVAYLSSDFHDHATAHLAAELFELHDKDRFELTAISFGPDTGDAMRARLQRAFTHFVDVGKKGDRDVARMLRQAEIDIAVDLKGFTANSRTGILALRPAPVQVNYLGYPGTMGAPYIDYIIADRHVIPPDHDAYFTERVVRLPDAYQVNDSKRRIADETPTRADAGLPESGFVFCCFNSNYKITPEVFDVWMRLLNEVAGSVLWLLEVNARASENLRREALQRFVAPERLIFARPMPLDRHLARHRLADLFLDTRPVSAHTTASDALWAGLPLLTCTVEAFAARVAASLLHAIGLPDLITDNLRDYESMASRLASTPALLAELRSRLERNRGTHPLFDTPRYRRYLESAYTGMWERYQRGEPPASFAIEATA
jgi:protein O-GlcNAc transferase